MDALAPAIELSALIRSGDLRSAGEWLVGRYAADVVSFCRSWVRERELAEDLAQDVFSNTFANLRSFRAEASPRTWLLSIARNRCIDHTRRQQREPFATEDDDAHEPDAHADDGPLPAELLVHKTYVEAALGELEEGDRALVILRFRHGLEYPELANVFGLREGTVRMRLSRALTRMRHALELREEQIPIGRGRAAGAPAPARATLPQAGSAGRPPPPPPGAPAPPPMAQPAGFGAPPPRPAASAGPARSGLWATVRRWLAPAPAVSSDFGYALAPPEPDVSERLVAKLEALVSGLPDRSK